MKKGILSLLLVLMLLLGSACTAAPREIKEAVIDSNGVLIIKYTDGTQSELGVVTGKDGKDGTDGINGQNGVPGQNGADGINGKDGQNGANGKDGINGQNGRGIQSISLDEAGAWKITFDDETVERIETTGNMVLFAGMCGDTAAWVVYSGGLLMLGGKRYNGLCGRGSTVGGVDPDVECGLCGSFRRIDGQ